MSPDSLIVQIATQGFSGLLSNLATSYLQRVGRKIKQDGESIKRDLKDHLEATFKKCTRMKTILDHEVAVDTLAIYVDQSFSLMGKKLDQYALIDKIRKGESFIIIGEGGGGKSMFMRYLWLSFFEKSDGKIPFFLELRNLNTLSHKNISDFIYHSIIKSGSSIRQDDFLEGMKDGEFILFLDGFDEINFDRRDSVQDMLLDLKAANPALSIIVTSRSDERFYGWDSFIQARVNPMGPEQARKVIERANYNAEMRTKFLAKFDALYADHAGFLSNPLLAYMMLVTFAFNPDIPKRMFLFYEQAFEALYHRHDLAKGYKRTFHCNLDKFDFLRLVSYFCFGTYIDEQYEFTRHELLEAIERARKIENYSVKPENFLDDLVQSVCLIKLEGLTYTFTHRSFQEYFSAHCIARVAVRNIDRLFGKLSSRLADRVLPMVAGMNPDLVREKYIAPNVEKFPACLDPNFKNFFVVAQMTNAKFTVKLLDKARHGNPKRTALQRHYTISLTHPGVFSTFFWTILSIASSKDQRPETSRKSDDNFAERAIDLVGKNGFPIFVESDGSKMTFDFQGNVGSKLKSNPDIHNSLNDAFIETGMAHFLSTRASLFHEFVSKEMQRNTQIDEAFSDFF